MAIKLTHKLKVTLSVMGIVILLVIFLGFYQAGLKLKQNPSSQGTATADNQASNSLPTRAEADVSPSTTASPAAAKVTFVGPRQNLPDGAPDAYGFWSLAEAVPGVLARSGQPLPEEFTWLKQNGWKGDVDLRITGDHGEQADDAKLPGFSALGMNYLHLEIVDGHPPTTDQAMQFLQFVTNPVNQPVLVHCRGGIGRTGTVVALYRYAVQGWPMDQAIAESRLFSTGIDDTQKAWLMQWAKDHPAGSFNS